METLLEKAQKVENRGPHGATLLTQEHYDLAIAWARGEISYKQAATALGSYRVKGGVGNVPFLLARALREAIMNGYVKLSNNLGSNA